MTPNCGWCGGRTFLFLGHLGPRLWARCRDCGGTTELPEDYDPEEDGS